MKFFTVPTLRVPTKMEDDFFVTADGIPEWARLNGRQCYIGGRAAHYFNLCIDGDGGGHSVDAGCKGFCDLIAIIVYDIVDAIEAASNVVHCPGVVHAIEAEGMHSVLGAQIFHAYAPCSAGAGWLPPSHGHYSHEPASSTSLSRKRTSNDTNQLTKQAAN